MVNIPPGLVAGGKAAFAEGKCQSRMRIDAQWPRRKGSAQLDDQADDQPDKG
jgi:hypothetical protein